jgi:Mg-chelatase subunit ChlD
MLLFTMALLVIVTLGTGSAGAQSDSAMPGTYGLKIYQVNEILYPYVQVYFRTFDKSVQPLVNLNEMNIGLMVKGRPYDPAKRQYFIQSLRQRQEATRTVIILDASKSMAGTPFESALRACARFIDSKRPQDEVSILAIRDTKEGYEIVSEYERDPGALARRLADVKCDGKKTRLYDTVGAALEGCGMSSQGSISPSGGAYICSCSIVVFSDGQDDGSAITREELNARITTMRIPIPIYSLAFSRVGHKYFHNLEALSKNSVGKYYLIGEAFDRMQRVVEEIQNIIQSDYVLTFRSFVPVDGNEYNFKLGVEFPSGSGKYTYDTAKFEAVEPPPVPQIEQKLGELSRAIPALPAGAEPYFDRQPSQQPAKPAGQ